MAAQGTGLGTPGGDTTTTLTDMRGYGAGEAAAAEALNQAARGFDKIVRAIEPAANEAAKVIGEQKAAAGQFEQRLAITGADVAFNDAIRTGTMARLANSRDADLDALRLEHAFDPDGFARASAEYKTNALNGAVPGQLAVEWGAEFDARANRTLSVIRNARMEAEVRESGENARLRIERLRRETVDLADGRPWASLADDPEIQGNILQMTMLAEGLAANPAFGVGEEEALALIEGNVNEVIAGATASEHLNILRTQGADAALASVNALATAEGFTSETQRALVVSKTRAAVNEEIAGENQRRNQALAERNAAETAMRRLIEDDVARMALTGAPSSLTEEQVRAAGGDSMVLEWITGRARSLADHNRYGDMSGMTPDEAARHIETVSRSGADPTTGVSGDTIFTPPVPGEPTSSFGPRPRVRTTNGQMSSGNHGGVDFRGAIGDPVAAAGAGTVIYAGPQGGYGNVVRIRHADGRETSYAHLSRIDVAVGQTVAGGARIAAVGATGNVTGPHLHFEVTENGRRVDPMTYFGDPSAVRAAERYASQRQQRLTDPASTVLQEPDVNVARTRFAANPTDPAAGEMFVEANLNAQDRRGISQGDRRTLPNAVLVPYAGAIRRVQGDPEAYQALSDRIVENFGEHGERVLQDVLTLAGQAEYAAQVAAAATSSRRTGSRPPAPAQVETAQRTTAINNAATGRAPNVRAMSDDEILAAAGLQ